MRSAVLPRRILTKLTVAVLAVALVACRQQEAPVEAEQATTTASLPAGLYRAGDRDALCMKADGRAGFVTFAPGAERTNCSVRGRLENGAIVPDGDEACRIPVTQRGTALQLGDGGGSCAYYCGPNASFANREFTRQGGTGTASDLAGEPLC